MPAASPKEEQVKRELREAGMTTFGFAKFNTRHLPEALHDNEHIKGVVYGRYEAGTGAMRWEQGMIVATDHRILFLDRKPGFNTVDELSYEAVSGAQKSYAWPFASMTLHTRVQEYLLRYANKKCVDIFVSYVEKRRLDEAEKATSQDTQQTSQTPLKQPQPEQPPEPRPSQSPDAMPGAAQPQYQHLPQPAPQQAQSQAAVVDNRTAAFLNNHNIAVLSTANDAGRVLGAPVYYRVVANEIFCIPAIDEAQNIGNFFNNTQRPVTLVAYDQSMMQTLHIRGTATAVPQPVAHENTPLRITPAAIQLFNFDPSEQLALTYL